MKPVRRTDRLGPLLAAVVALVLGALLLGGGFKRIEAQRMEQEMLAEELQAATDLVVAMRQAESALNAGTATLDAGRIPERMAFSQFYQAMQQSAEALGVTIDRLHHEPSVVEEELEVLPIRLLAGGDFTGLYQFLHALGRQQRLVKIDSLVVLGTEDPGRCEAEMALRIYALRRPV